MRAAAAFGRPIVRFLDDEDGAVSVYVLLISQALFILFGMAVDMSFLNAQRRYVQAQADLSAVSAAFHLRSAEEARGAARATAAANRTFEALPLRDDQIVFGNLSDEGRFLPVADQSSVSGVSAVAVEVHSPYRFRVMGLFLATDEPVLARAAVAERAPRVSFTLSNCLLSLNLYGGLIAPVVGTDLDALCEGHGLRVNALTLLDTLAVEATALTPGATYGDVLDAEIRYSDVLSAALDRSVPLQRETVRLGEILYLSDSLREARVGSPLPPIEVQAADIVFGAFELLQHNVANLEIELDLGPETGATTRLRILEPRQVVLGAIPGDPEAVARTSQVRLEIEDLRIGTVFDLKLNAGVANASARLAEAGCGDEPGDLAARFAPVEASLLDIGLGVEALGLPVSLQGRSTRTTSLLSSEELDIAFTREEVDEHHAESFGPGLAENLPELMDELLGTTAGLLTLVRDDLSRNVPLGLGGLLHGILGHLQSAASHVRQGHGAEGTEVEAILEDLVELGLAEARLEVLSVDCPSRLAL